MPDESHSSTAGPEPIADAAARIAADGDAVRERVRRLVLDAAGGQGLGLASLRRAAVGILDGVTAEIRRSADLPARGVLHETVTGLSEGLASAAHATKLAIQEAEGRGTQFAQDDLRRTADDLRTLEKMLIDVVSDATGRLSGEARAQLGDVTEHASRAAQSMRPSIESAIEAATRSPGRLVSEAASMGVGSARGAVGSILGMASGLLDAAAEIVSGQPKPTDRPPARGAEDQPADRS